ncbi:hypothetical protein HWI79_3191 [Cryptosporidium felis]|nr:hypothetical protein HWI79_3191 [Cryptosporidium felis]
MEDIRQLRNTAPSLLMVRSSSSCLRKLFCCLGSGHYDLEAEADGTIGADFYEEDSKTSSSSCAKSSSSSSCCKSTTAKTAVGSDEENVQTGSGIYFEPEVGVFQEYTGPFNPPTSGPNPGDGAPGDGAPDDDFDGNSGTGIPPPEYTVPNKRKLRRLRK